MAMSNGRVARGSLEARGVRACVSYRKLAELSTLATSRTTLIKKKIILCISRDTVRSFTLFITVKTITKLNLKHSDKF